MQYASGDPANPLAPGSAFTTISNFNISAPNFAINLDATADTNLLLTAGALQSAVYIPGTGPVLSLVPVTANSPTISVGTVTTGAAGSAVVVTNVGSSTVMVLNFAIPQGSNGPAGPAGTNTVTVINFSNQVLSSQQILAYSTNNIVWARPITSAPCRVFTPWLLTADSLAWVGYRRLSPT